MDNNRDLIVVPILFLLTAGFLACSLALHAMATSLPYIILAGAGAVCLITVTVTKCYAMVIEARQPRYYLEDRRDWVKGGWREIKPARGLLGRGR